MTEIKYFKDHSTKVNMPRKMPKRFSEINEGILIIY